MRRIVRIGMIPTRACVRGRTGMGPRRRRQRGADKLFARGPTQPLIVFKTKSAGEILASRIGAFGGCRHSPFRPLRLRADS